MSKHLTIKELLGVLLILLCFLPGMAQPKLVFEHLNTEDGLTGPRINSIFQDSKGYMWFGTLSGLNRYDGRQIKTYAYDPDQPKLNSPTAVWQIVSDPSGKMWFWDYYTGLFLYHPEKDEFETFQINQEDYQIRSIYVDRSGELWVGTLNRGLMRLNRETGLLVSFAIESNKNLEPKYVTEILEDNFGNLWFSYPNGIYQFVRAENEIIYHSFSEDYERLIHDKMIFALFEDSRHMLWVGTEKGLFSLDRTLNRFIQYPLDPHNPEQTQIVNNIAEAPDGKLWISSIGKNYGLHLVDPRTKERSYHPANLATPGALTSNQIISIYSDHQGDMWIGTLNAGVFHWSQNRKAFLGYEHSPDIPTSFPPARATSFLEREDGHIWVSSDYKLELFDPIREQFLHGQSPIASCHRIIEDKNGQIWAGSWVNGLSRFDPSSKQAVRYLANPQIPGSLPGDAANEVFADRQGIIWVGVQTKGLYRYNPDNDDFTAHPLLHPENEDTLTPMIKGMYEDVNRNLWIGASSLIKLKPERTVEAVYDIPFCRSFHQDDKGILWLGTLQGLYRLDINSGEQRFWREKDGLSHNRVNGVLEDDRGRLWLGTQKGLSCFNPETETFRNFDASDGLPGVIFEDGACLKTRSGEFYFGLNQGVLRFHPDSIGDNPNIPPIIITDFRIGYQSVPIKGRASDSLETSSPLQQHISFEKEIQLSWWQNDISFEFASLNYFHPEKNQYKYTLENYDEGWISTNTKRPYAPYTNLDPGQYTFRVIGSNNDGVWNEEGTSILLFISPPWWRSGWAYVLYSLLILISLWAIRQYELKRQGLKHQLELEYYKANQLEEINQLKSRFFTNISHEIRTPLTLILGPLQDLMDRLKRTEYRGPLELIQRNGQRLLQLINQLLELSKLEAKAMNLQAARNDIVPFLRQLFATFNSIADSRNIRYSFRSDCEQQFVYYDRKKLEQVLLNILGNAFKFTPDGGKIELVLNTSKEGLRIICSDSGPGIAADQLPHIFDRFYQVDPENYQGTGVGLALVNELVKLHHGTIKVESVQGQGTSFILQLPLGATHLKEDEIVKPTVAKPIDVTLIGAHPAVGTSISEGIYSEGDLPVLLIAEDNTDMRSYIRQSFYDQFRIVEAADGRQAFSFAIEQVPDIIISDIMMPKMNGFELCKKLKKDIRTSHIPIILLTAKVDIDSKMEGLQGGADAYLSKPFYKQELELRLHKMIELRKKLQQRYQSSNTLHSTGSTDPQIEDAFMKKFRQLIEDHMGDINFDIPHIYKSMGMSRAQLYRKVKALTNESVGNCIRSARLHKALALLKTAQLNVSEVAYEVGFKDPAHFSKSFKEEFGISPSKVY